MSFSPIVVIEFMGLVNLEMLKFDDIVEFNTMRTCEHISRRHTLILPLAVMAAKPA